MVKNYNELFDLFYGDYTERYCKEKRLFVDYDSAGNVKNITRSLIDYAYEIIMTDYALIFGKRFEIRTDKENVQEALERFLETNNALQTFRLFVAQGLILGDTALKLGRDDKGNVRLGLVNLLKGTLDYRMEYGQIVEWIYEYDQKHGDGYVRIKEVYRRDRVQMYRDGQIVLDIPNRYGEFWLIHVANIPSLKDPVWGESELERIGDTIDEMNSTLSRISAIEDIYAKPRIIASGIHDISNLKQEHNVWAIPDGAEFKILEYQGDVIPSMLKKYEMLENYLRNKCPELILNDLGSISGYALRLKLSKLIRKIENYRAVYFEGIKRACRFALKMHGFVNADDLQIVTDPVIPADELQDLNKLITLLSMNIISKKTVAEALEYDFEKERERIEEENAWFLGLMQNGQADTTGKTVS